MLLLRSTKRISTTTPTQGFWLDMLSRIRGIVLCQFLIRLSSSVRDDFNEIIPDPHLTELERLKVEVASESRTRLTISFSSGLLIWTTKMVV